MRDIFIECPQCQRAVSRADHDKKTIERYGFTLVDAFLPVMCFHCKKSSYYQEWKIVDGKPDTKFDNDLFEI